MPRDSGIGVRDSSLRSAHNTNVLSIPFYAPKQPATLNVRAHHILERYAIITLCTPPSTALCHHPSPFHYAFVFAAASAAILASIFFLAARIISSRLLFINSWRSALFWLQACLPDGDGRSSSSAFALSLAPRLYREMRSGWAGFADELETALVDGATTRTGIGG